MDATPGLSEFLRFMYGVLFVKFFNPLITVLFARVFRSCDDDQFC